jgi:hypothetical protein
LFPLFASGVIDTGSKLPLVSLTLVANLSPVSTTLAQLVAKFATGLTDASGAPCEYIHKFSKNLKRS